MVGVSAGSARIQTVDRDSDRHSMDKRFISSPLFPECRGRRLSESGEGPADMPQFSISARRGKRKVWDRTHTGGSAFFTHTDWGLENNPKNG